MHTYIPKNSTLTCCQIIFSACKLNMKVCEEKWMKAMLFYFSKKLVKPPIFQSLLEEIDQEIQT